MHKRGEGGEQRNYTRKCIHDITTDGRRGEDLVEFILVLRGCNDVSMALSKWPNLVQPASQRQIPRLADCNI